MPDLLLIETGSGGDIILAGNDILTEDSFCNQIYIALFGGNNQERDVDAEESSANQLNLNWWGNDLFFDNEDEKFISITEKKLYNITLNSRGRQELEQAVIRDLKYLDQFADVTIVVAIVGNDRLEIRVQLIEPNNVDNKTFVYLWDNAKQSGLICGNDIDYDLLIEQSNANADFNNDFNLDFNS